VPDVRDGRPAAGPAPTGLSPALARIAVRLQPRAARDEIVGERDGRIVVRVCAPALEGRANRALRRLIAERASVAPSRLAIVSGVRSRDKLVRVDGIEVAAVRAALAGT
jgi:uncharacterized protein (TIGR00251 family)